MARGVGIEISSHRVRAAVVEMAARKPRLVAFHEIPILDAPDGKPDLVAALKEAAQKAPGGRTVIGLDSGEVIVRELTLPFKGEEQIRKTVAFELEHLVHNYSIEELVVDTLKTGETEKGTTLLATAVPRKMLAARLKELEAAGIDPSAVDLDMVALFNAYERTGGVTSDDPFLIVYGTSRFTKILLVEGKRPKALRSIRLAIPSKEHVETERRDRKQLLETHEGDPPSPIVIVTEEEKGRVDALDSGTHSELIEILAKEISRFLLATASAATPTHVFLAGDYENDEAALILEASLAIPVKLHDPMAAVEHTLSPEQAAHVGPRVGVALGLGLRALEAGGLGLDFRRGEFAFKGKFEGLKTASLVGLELLIVLLAVVGLNFYLGYRTQTSALDRMLQMHAELYKDTMGREIAPAQAYDQLVKDHRELATTMGGGEHPIEKSALELWNQVFKAIDQFAIKHQAKQLSDQKMYLMVDSFDVRQITLSGSEAVTISIHGVIQNEEYAQALRQEIVTAEPFKDGRWELKEGNFTPTAEGRKKFNFIISRGKRG